MNEFSIYLKLGFEHITDPNGYDHIIFLIALCAIYRLTEWRKVLILITAFTLGHSFTLALATLQVIQYRTDIIEFLIPCTILLTASLNILQPTQPDNIFAPVNRQRSSFRYILALCFGLIHGMGFSTFLRSLLGKEASIVQPLLAFNIGLELGQILIVFGVLTLAWILIDLFRVKKNNWKLVVSGAVAGIAIILIKESDYWQELMGK
ncbi:MAG: HupE/UreJ family protein [Siphonobacter sp.]